jgi:hypothetical protein
MTYKQRETESSHARNCQDKDRRNEVLRPKMKGELFRKIKLVMPQHPAYMQLDTCTRSYSNL